MKRFHILLTVALLSLATHAQNPYVMMDKAVETLKSAGMVSAGYSMSGKDGSFTGTIVMSGTKFRVLSKPFMTWYDGKTQWTFSATTGEVNITTPTQEDLQMTNPYAAVTGFKKNFYWWRSFGAPSGMYAIKLIPKKKSNIKSLIIDINEKNYQIQRARFFMKDGSTTTLKISNYKSGVKLPASTFTFDKKAIPPGVEVVDLR